jgi:hypothetical protein
MRGEGRLRGPCDRRAHHSWNFPLMPDPELEPRAATGTDVTGQGDVTAAEPHVLERVRHHHGLAATSPELRARNGSMLRSNKNSRSSLGTTSRTAAKTGLWSPAASASPLASSAATKASM